MTTPLLYLNAHEMDPEPVGRTGSLGALGIMLSMGFARAVRLEPGDGTRYDVLLVPCWGADYLHTFSSYTGEDEAKGYLCVTLVNHTSSCGILHRGARWQDVADRLRLGNEWTARFLAWWLDHVWDEIDNQRRT